MPAVPADTPRRVTVLGSTGSVGQNTVDLLLRNPDSFEVEALTANRDAVRLAAQARALRARFAAIADPAGYPILKEALAGTGIVTACGAASVVEAALRPADWVMAAIVGAAGLEPTLAAIRRGVIVGLANKEVLVCAGELVMQEVIRHGATLLPVDSEHNAIWQCFDFTRVEAIEKIMLTASGGPFRERSLDGMRDVTPEEAVAHPNWRMGAKISVDSATMMNKGLEVIEAHHLFRLPLDRIDVVVHPQSIIHGLVTYNDGSVLAQLGSPDMRTPIAYVLGWPGRIPAPVKGLDLAAIGRLDFERPDLSRFPCLRLAYQALRAEGGAPAVLNAANEIAVAAFLDGRIRFTAIATVVESVLGRMQADVPGSLDAVLAIDHEARARAVEVLQDVTGVSARPVQRQAAVS